MSDAAPATDPTDATVTEPAAPTQETTPAAPAPAEPAKADDASKVEITPEIKALIDAAFKKGSEKAEQKASKTLEERLADIEAKAVASEKAAVNAIIAKAAASAHDSSVVAKLIDLADLTSADAAAIEAKVAEYLAANPYLVKTDAGTTVTPAPVAVAPTPGAGAAGTVPAAPSADFMSDEEFEKVTSDELAADEQLMKRYLATAALKG